MNFIFLPSEDKVNNSLKVTPQEIKYARKLVRRLYQEHICFICNSNQTSIYLVFENNEKLETAERILSEFDVESGNELKVEKVFIIQTLSIHPIEGLYFFVEFTEDGVIPINFIPKQ